MGIFHPDCAGQCGDIRGNRCAGTGWRGVSGARWNEVEPSDVDQDVTQDQHSEGSGPTVYQSALPVSKSTIEFVTGLIR
ncbi:hypothetical protein, partial [Amycolatopsis suaedae]|uniref:hypothetical protein n=1 Tax=Amycolatopsis suaedae TaxID=2510978 RepID=UPI00196B44CC